MSGSLRFVADLGRNSFWRFAEAANPNAAQLTREVGIPGGTRDDNGLTVEAYSPDLQGQDWFQKVDRLLVASSQAAVVELCWCLPVVSAEWAVVGGSQKLNDLCTTALLSPAGMSTTWPEVCYNAATSALYGTAFFEIVWKELTVGRPVDRDVSSIDRYEWDADGGLKACHYPRVPVRASCADSRPQLGTPSSSLALVPAQLGQWSRWPDEAPGPVRRSSTVTGRGPQRRSGAAHSAKLELGVPSWGRPLAEVARASETELHWPSTCRSAAPAAAPPNSAVT